MKNSKFWESRIESDEYLDAETVENLKKSGLVTLCDVVLCFADEGLMMAGPPPSRGVNSMVVMHLAKRLKDHFNLEPSLL